MRLLNWFIMLNVKMLSFLGLEYVVGQVMCYISIIQLYGFELYMLVVYSIYCYLLEKYIDCNDICFCCCRFGVGNSGGYRKSGGW